MKTCASCKLSKPLEEFATKASSSDGRQNLCKPCKKQYNATYYERTKERHNPGRAERRKQMAAETKQRFWKFLIKQSCADCGERDPVVLEFDHIQGEKLANISYLVGSGVAWSRIEAELKKCEAVCANCHRRRTAKTYGWYASVAQLVRASVS